MRLQLLLHLEMTNRLIEARRGEGPLLAKGVIIIRPYWYSSFAQPLDTCTERQRRRLPEVYIRVYIIPKHDE